MIFFSLLRNTQAQILFFSIAGSVFLFQLYLMHTLPGTNGYQCVLGANFTWDNIMFALLLSVAVAFIFLGLNELIKQKKELMGLELGTLSGIAALFGVLTVFCTFCTLPIISFFGASIALTWFTDYEWYFKCISLILLGVSLYILNQQLNGVCNMCKIKKKNK